MLGETNQQQQIILPDQQQFRLQQIKTLVIIKLY